MMQQLSNKELINELGCLRNSLTPFLNKHFQDVLQESERRLKTGAVSTAPVTFKKKESKGNNINALKSKYYYSKQK